MASQLMSMENTYSTKTLVGNWNEERTLFGNNYHPNVINRPLTSYNIMTNNINGKSNPAVEYRKLQSAGFSRTNYSRIPGLTDNVSGKTWSSLSLSNAGPQSDNQFLTTVRKNYNNPGVGLDNVQQNQVDVKANPGVAYNHRNWKMIRGHWLPEPIDNLATKQPVNYGLIQSKEKEWADIENAKIFNKNKSVYNSSFRELVRPGESKNIYPKRITKTSLDRSTSGVGFRT